jgi:hypothetical protein
MIVRKFYVVRVDYLKPLLWEELAESLDTEDMVYLVYSERQNIVLSDVRVGEYPHACQAA